MEQSSKTVLITGGTSGIGLELALIFARQKYRVVIAARDQKGLDQTAAGLRQISGQEVVTIISDLSQPQASEKLYDQLKRKNIVLDVLVNNAGFAEYGLFKDISLEKHLSLVQLNATSPMVLMKLVLDDMVRRNEGKILNVVSGAAFQAGAMLSVYHATKAFMLFMTEAVQEELKDTNVTVTALCPGPTKTAYHEKAHLTTRLMKFNYMEAATVARAGYNGLMSGKTVVVPGLINKLIIQSIRLAPRKLVVKITRWLQEPAE